MPAPITVLLVTNYRPDAQYSMLRFSSLLTKHGQEEGIRFRETTPQPKLNRKYAPKKFRKWLGYADKFLLFPQKLKSETKRFAREAPGSTILHVVDHSNSLYLRESQDSLPNLLTCHDLIAVQSALGEFPSIRLSFTGKSLQRIIRSSITFADHIACDSQSTETQLHRICPEVSNRSNTIPLGLPIDSISTRPLRDPPFPIESTKFLLHVGNSAWYKNRKTVIQGFLLAYQRSPEENRKLILVGPPPSKEETSEVCSSTLLQFKKHIHILSNINDPALNHLYENAEAFLFPSLLEGFGWPPLEAQSHGCPVIASHAGSLKEVLADSCLVVDPEDPQSLAIAIEKLSSDSITHDRLKRKGLENASRFSFGITARKYANTYRMLIKQVQ